MILILGMHRSGTSALAGGVAALGAGFGERLMQAVPDQNAKGFWEDLDVVSIDDRVLLALGRTWDSIEPIAPDEATYPRAFENTLVALLIFSGIYLMIALTAAVLREQVTS